MHPNKKVRMLAPDRSEGMSTFNPNSMTSYGRSFVDSIHKTRGLEGNPTRGVSNISQNVLIRDYNVPNFKFPFGGDNLIGNLRWENTRSGEPHTNGTTKINYFPSQWISHNYNSTILPGDLLVKIFNHKIESEGGVDLLNIPCLGHHMKLSARNAFGRLGDLEENLDYVLNSEVAKVKLTFSSNKYTTQMGSDFRGLERARFSKISDEIINFINSLDDDNSDQYGKLMDIVENNRTSTLDSDITRADDGFSVEVSESFKRVYDAITDEHKYLNVDTAFKNISILGICSDYYKDSQTMAVDVRGVTQMNKLTTDIEKSTHMGLTLEKKRMAVRHSGFVGNDMKQVTYLQPTILQSHSNTGIDESVDFSTSTTMSTNEKREYGSLKNCIRRYWYLGSVHEIIHRGDISNYTLEKMMGIGNNDAPDLNIEEIADASKGLGKMTVTFKPTPSTLVN